ncbi:MAG TPA: hypothetical protein VFG78_09425 [Gemmatimonadota bacterium]|nr:hypothetical protein [Gemmatimonadota bacterium]
MGKVRVAKTRRQGLLRASLLGLALQACGPDAARTVLIEADTTEGSLQAVDSPPGSGEPAELVFLDADSLALEQGSAEEEALREEPSAVARSGSDTRRGAVRTRAARGDAGATDDRVAVAADPEEAREPGGRPPPPVLLTSGRVLLPAGTVLAAELRTPLHTATTVVGDRFAARLTQAIAAGGRVVIPVGAVVEGRVSHVGNASEPGYIAFLRLEARKIQLGDGRRLRIRADVLDVTGQEVVERGRDGRRSEVRRGAITLSSAAADARRAMLDSILIGLAGRAIVARTADKEIIVAAGTTFTLELVEPLEIPASG